MDYIIIIAIAVMLIIAWALVGYPIWRVWASHRSGLADLQQAKNEQQIQIAEAQSRLDAAGLNKKAAVIEAEAVAAMKHELNVDYGLSDSRRNVVTRGVPLNHLVENIGILPKDRSLLVYCAGGYRSSIAASLLQKNGFDRVSEIAGGLAGWEAAKLPLQTA